MTLRAIAGFAAGVYENILSTVFVRKFPENIGALCGLLVFCLTPFCVFTVEVC